MEWSSGRVCYELDRDAFPQHGKKIKRMLARHCKTQRKRKLQSKMPLLGQQKGTRKKIKASWVMGIEPSKLEEDLEKIATSLKKVIEHGSIPLSQLYKLNDW